MRIMNVYDNYNILKDALTLSTNTRKTIFTFLTKFTRSLRKKVIDIIWCCFFENYDRFIRNNLWSGFFDEFHCCKFAWPSHFTFFKSIIFYLLKMSRNNIFEEPDWKWNYKKWGCCFYYYVLPCFYDIWKNVTEM